MARWDRYSSPDERPTTRSPSRWLRVGVVLVLCIVARARVLGDAVEEATPNEGVSIPGRVVDLENGNPVKGASVVVERLLPGLPASILPAWAGATILTTDSDGRFVVSIPPFCSSTTQAKSQRRS
jgi:hypothetical protein